MGSKYFHQLFLLVLTTKSSRRVDDRDRRDRTKRNTENWAIQMDFLVQAYLDFRSAQGVDGLNTNAVGNEGAESSSMDVIDLFCKSYFTLCACYQTESMFKSDATNA